MTSDIQDQIKARLSETLSPTHIELIDESHRHIGHPGALSGGGHFKLIIASPLFTQQTQIAIHRMIYAALGSWVGREIHALTIEIKA